MYLEQKTNADISEDTIGTRIKARKEQLGFTVGTIASYSGLSENTIYSLMRDETKNPSIRTLHNLAFALGCEVPDLVPSLFGNATYANVISMSSDMVVEQISYICETFADSISDMARKLQISRSRLQDVLNNDQPPTLSLVQNICDTFALKYFDVIPISSTVPW